jgi:hypothetical protein
MLTARSITALATTTVVVIIGAGPALADDGKPIVVKGDNNGVVSTSIHAPGSPATATSRTEVASSSSDDTAAGVSCAWSLDATNNSVLLESGQPGSLAAEQYAAGGRFYKLTCSDGTYRSVYVPPGSPSPAATARATPATLAKRAYNNLKLPTPKPRHSPAGQALVGLPTWWFLSSGSWQSLSQRTAAGPVWAQVHARPVRTIWDAGDGSEPVVCDGPGTPYDPSRPAAAQHTDCEHTYRRSSAGQPQTGPNPNNRHFTVTVTVVWQVRWRGAGGASGELPELRRTSRFPLRVAERQTLVTGGSG